MRSCSWAGVSSVVVFVDSVDCSTCCRPKGLVISFNVHNYITNMWTPVHGKPLLNGLQGYVGQMAGAYPNWHSRSPTGNLESPVDLHVFELWEEARVPREYPMQTHGQHGNFTQRGFLWFFYISQDQSKGWHKRHFIFSLFLITISLIPYFRQQCI